MSKFWNFRSRTNDAGETSHELELFGEITKTKWFDDDVTPDMFRAELEQCVGDITVWINSPGGECVSASVIYSMLREYNGKVTVKITGIAASAASVVAMAGDTVLMAPTALMMIHNPTMEAWGDHNTMRQAMEALDEVKESIINAYELKTGLSRVRISHMLEEETYMAVEKAMEYGFADGMMGYESENSKAYTYNVAEIKKITNQIAAKARKKDSGVKVSDLKAKLYERLLRY